jgi:DNA invertase Pin-like site-specific DNA recombinase
VPDGTHAKLIRCVIYDRISDDKADDGHGVLNQRTDLLRRAAARGWTVIAEESDNDIGVTRSIANALGHGKHRDGWAAVLRMVDAREVDVVLVWRWDRALREPIDLERLIPRFDAAGVRFAEADGIIDLGTDSGRLAARILVAVAKAEQERKIERQKLANRGTAERGEIRKGGRRRFGWKPGNAEHDPAEAQAIRAASRRLVGGGPKVTLSVITAEWTQRAHAHEAGYRPRDVPFGPLVKRPWTDASVKGILLNPANAGLSEYRGEIVADGKWEAIVSPEMQKAVRAKLDNGPRSVPEGKERRAGRTLLGSLALCQCGAPVQGAPTTRGKPGYRCSAVVLGEADQAVPHVKRAAADCDAYVRAVVIERMSRDDAVSLLAVSDEVDVTALHEEAATIKLNLEEMAADRAAGLLTRAEQLAGSQRGKKRLTEISAALDEATRHDVLADLYAAEDMGAAWDASDLGARRAWIDALMTVILLAPGRGAKGFNPDTVVIEWKRG